MSTEDKKAPQAVEVPTMTANVAPAAHHAQSGLPQETGGKFLGRTGVYWLELVVAMLVLGIAASVISFSLYSLCSSLGDWTNGGAGMGGLWFAASTIVWTPIAYIFYMRVRGYELRHPNEVSNDAAQRVLVIIYQILTILAIIGFALAAVYSLLVALTQSGTTGKTLLDSTLPSFLSALLYAAMFTAFFRRPVISRKAFGAIFLAASLIVVLPTIVVTVIQIRQQNDSHSKQNDTYTPSYYNDNNSNSYYNYNTYSN